MKCGITFSCEGEHAASLIVGQCLQLCLCMHVRPADMEGCCWPPYAVLLPITALVLQPHLDR